MRALPRYIGIIQEQLRLESRYHRFISIIPVEFDRPRSSSQTKSISISIGYHHQGGFRLLTITFHAP
jgi:hypothetical protein